AVRGDLFLRVLALLANETRNLLLHLKLDPPESRELPGACNLLVEIEHAVRHLGLAATTLKLRDLLPDHLGLGFRQDALLFEEITETGLDFQPITRCCRGCTCRSCLVFEFTAGLCHRVSQTTTNFEELLQPLEFFRRHEGGALDRPLLTDAPE